jgi:hypothetical protein
MNFGDCQPSPPFFTRKQHQARHVSVLSALPRFRGGDLRLQRWLGRCSPSLSPRLPLPGRAIAGERPHLARRLPLNSDRLPHFSYHFSGSESQVRQPLRAESHD